MTSMEGVRGAVFGDMRRCSVLPRGCRTARAHLDRYEGPRSRTTRRLLSSWRCDCANAVPAQFRMNLVEEIRECFEARWCASAPSARLPPAIQKEIPMRRIGLAVVLALGVNLFAIPTIVKAQSPTRIDLLVSG